MALEPMIGQARVEIVEYGQDGRGGGSIVHFFNPEQLSEAKKEACSRSMRKELALVTVREFDEYDHIKIHSFMGGCELIDPPALHNLI